MNIEELATQKTELDKVLSRCVKGITTEKAITADIKALNDLYKSIELSLELEEMLHKNISSKDDIEDLKKVFEE